MNNLSDFANFGQLQIFLGFGEGRREGGPVGARWKTKNPCYASVNDMNSRRESNVGCYHACKSLTTPPELFLWVCIKY